MLDWLRGKKKPAPLTGAPAVRRQKTYSGQSGYVYQYFYEGHRPSERDGQPGAEYVFDVSADRKTSFPVSIFLSEGALLAWESERGRRLMANERYAIAKMALFQAFDERENPQQMRHEVQVRPADVAAILSTLDLG
jgi:hypothetical protein